MSTPLDIKAVAKGAILGGVAAGVVCIGLYFVGAALGATYRPRDPEVMMGLEVLPFYQPMVNCVLAGLVSFALVAALSRITPSKAWPIYLGIAALVFLGEAYAPFWAFSDVPTIVILQIMHVPAAAFVIGGIYKLAIAPRARAST